MENEMQIFSNNEFGEVRTVLIDGEPWFVAKDISDILGYAQTSNMMKRIDEEDFISSKLDGMNMKSNFINESGFYAAVLGSKVEGAKKFKKWVTSEVLPSIRKTGSYGLVVSEKDKATLKVMHSTNEVDRLMALKEFQTVIETPLLETIEEQKPKVEYCDEVLQSETCISTTQIAKDYGMSAIKLNKILSDLKVQFKKGRTWYLYQKYAEEGYTHSKTSLDDSGNSHIYTYWTEKGRKFIHELLLKNNVIKA